MSIKDVGQKSTVCRASPMTVSSTSSKRSAKSIVGKASSSSIISENSAPGKGFGRRNPESHKQIPSKRVPSTDGKTSAVKSSNAEPKPQAAKSSTGLRSKLASKASNALCHDAAKHGQSYLRSSIGSCHDACKFGTPWAFEDSNPSKSGAKSSSNGSNKAVSKVGVSGTKASSKISATSKIPKISTVVKSPVRSCNFEAVKSALRTPAGKISVNSRIQSDVKLVKSNSRPSPERKYKVARSLFRSPREATNRPDHHREEMNLPMPKDIIDIKWQASTSDRPMLSSESPSGVLMNQAFDVKGRELLDINSQICDDQSEDDFFRDYSPCAGEPYYDFIQLPPGDHDRGSCNKINRECHDFGDLKVAQYANHPEIDSPFHINGDQYSSEYSESPRSAAIAEEYNDSIANKGHHRYLISEEKNATMAVADKRKFRGVRHSLGGIMNPEPENVVLRHQDMQGRKPSEEWMIDHVIGEAVNKLSHYEESKVKVLVGAFETVISLTDQSETGELKQIDPHIAKDLPHMRPLQACN